MGLFALEESSSYKAKTFREDVHRCVRSIIAKTVCISILREYYDTGKETTLWVILLKTDRWE